MKESFSFQSVIDNLTIYVDKYVPTNSCKVVVQIVHGMAEHKNRYESIAQFLCEHGYIVVIADNRGHGQSINDNIIHGYFGKEGSDGAVSDINQLTSIMKIQYPNYKYVMFGHSMGSLLVRKYLSKYSKQIDGVILSGTAGSNYLSGIGYQLARLDMLTKGDKHRSNFLNKLGFGSYNAKFKEKSEYAWLSRDSYEVKKYEDDPLCGFVFTTNGFMVLSELVSFVNKWSNFKNINKKLKIFIFSGNNDPVGNYGKGVKEVYKELNKIGLEKVDLKLYEDGRHEMLNEINKEEVFDDILYWLDSNIG